MDVTMEFLCDRMRQSNHARMIRMENFIEEQKVKKSLARIQWALLKESLEHTRKAMADVSSVQLAIRTEGYTVTVSNPEKGRRVVLSYAPNVPCVHVQGYDGSPYYAFDVVDNGRGVQFFDPAKHMGTMIDDIVIDVTDYLTR